MSKAAMKVSELADTVRDRVDALLAQMSLAEKIGQMNQVHAGDEYSPAVHAEDIRAGRIGSIINTVDVDTICELQRIAVEESRLGIPLLFGRDVIHGFHTVFPIPLGQAASFNPQIVREAARLAAAEASACGINWTFAPMLDVSRDARWGRIAESLGEDPLLAGELGAAMVRGFQGDSLSADGGILACAKHFAGYGASEAGRDYSTTNIPENELRNIYLRPFYAVLKAGVGSFMTSFSDLDGVPATANDFLLRDVLRDEWDFQGFVVSDWDSVSQLAVHGISTGDRDSAAHAALAGVDMEMAGGTYMNHLPGLVADGGVDEAIIDSAVANILRVKFSMGLFDRPYGDAGDHGPALAPGALATAREAARQSVVLLKNDCATLPLDPRAIRKVAVIGPLAHAPQDQLGTWVFDGDPNLSVSCLDGVRSCLGEQAQLSFVPAMSTSRSRDNAAFADAAAAAAAADVALLFLGEEAILSGEAHCRAAIDLPGAQLELLRTVRAAGAKVIVVVLAGRPLELTDVVDEVDALLFAWHPGTMAGPAIADLLFGLESPSGKLPVTFPRAVGQIPIYYNQKNTGKPPSAEQVVHIDDIDPLAAQTSLGMCAFHLDAGFEPLFPFGYGLSYAVFSYSHLRLSTHKLAAKQTIAVSVELRNDGAMAADEIVQLYIRDRVGSLTRPVRELKAFRRLRVDPGSSVRVEFELGMEDLAFYDRRQRLVAEAGDFDVWVGGSSTGGLHSSFELLQSSEV
ncbi:MAG: beta-glucosidase [Halieaceae bacterium]|jgi:beta-glucosidase